MINTMLLFCRVKSSVLRTLGLSKEEDQVAAPVPPSGYLTLIPLSDARLQPRNTRKTAFFLLIFALCIATAVFIAVPRSISIGDIHMEADTLTWNTSKVLYELRLTTSIPIYNPNYLSASVHGDLKIRFYDSEAGSTKIKPTVFPARSMPGMLDVNIDASGVPADYILSIVSQCSTFPHVLIFFLEGKLSASYIWFRQHLASIDTYFMISCTDGGITQMNTTLLHHVQR